MGRLPDAMSFDMGALLEPLCVAVHATRRAKITPQANKVLVFGAGPVGLMCAAMCRHEGVKRIMITDMQNERLDFALMNRFAHGGHLPSSRGGGSVESRLKEAECLAAELCGAGNNVDGRGFDVVFECTGAEACTRAAIYVSSPILCLLLWSGVSLQTLIGSGCTTRW